jgi:hypothetical protein
VFHTDDLPYILPSMADAKTEGLRRREQQLVRGRYSGVQRKIQCVVDCAGGSVATDHNGRRRYRKAAEALIYFTGLMVDARRDDAEMQRMLRRADGWLSSMLRMCKAYARKALYWNHGKFLDGKLPDFYAMGLAALSLDGSESFAEVIEAVQRFQGAYIEPHTNSKGSSQSVDSGGFGDGIKPRDSRKPRYDLSFAEYSAVKRLARASELRRVAGRVAFYKRRGDVHGFLNTMYGLMAGQVGHGGNKRGINTAKHRFGGIGSALIGSVLVSSVSAMDAAGKVASFLLDGVIG